MEASNKLDIWAIVELFGHSRIAGKVTDFSMNGSTFIRVDVPPVEGVQGFSRLLNPSAIYAINPVDEVTATVAAGKIKVQPLGIWDIKEALKAMPKELQSSISDTIDSNNSDFDDEDPDEHW